MKEGRVLRNGECQRKDGLYQYEILSQIEGESYILNSVEGKYGYNEVSAKYSCGFSNLMNSSMIVNGR
ncbi:MAG: integrase DNA-binding domain-containing protein [Acetatifactor sp.]